MFDWAPGIPILDDIEGNEDKGSYEENTQDDIVE